MTSPSANPGVSPSLMMSCESNQRRVWAALQWATEGMQRVILSGAPHKQLCPCLLQSHIILSRRLNCLSALTGNKLHVITEPFASLTVSLCVDSHMFTELLEQVIRDRTMLKMCLFLPTTRLIYTIGKVCFACVSIIWALLKTNLSRHNKFDLKQILIFFFLFFWLEVFVQHDTLSSKTVRFQRPFKCCFDKSMA